MKNPRAGPGVALPGMSERRGTLIAFGCVMNRESLLRGLFLHAMEGGTEKKTEGLQYPKGRVSCFVIRENLLAAAWRGSTRKRRRAGEHFFRLRHGSGITRHEKQLCSPHAMQTYLEKKD